MYRIAPEILKYLQSHVPKWGSSNKHGKLFVKVRIPHLQKIASVYVFLEVQLKIPFFWDTTLRHVVTESLPFGSTAVIFKCESLTLKDDSSTYVRHVDI
jgi:hypothetical protein